jgi:hypothetical protein
VSAPPVVPVPPVAAGVERPLWSVMIPTFNCAGTLRATLESVLAQDPGAEAMQIEVVDDCSTRDDPEAVVAELGHGRVGFHRQPHNRGHVANFNTCLQRSHGRLVHLLHGDDCVRDGFYTVMQRGFDTRPGIGAAFCRYISADRAGHWGKIAPLEQDEPGVLAGWLEKIAVGQRLQPPCVVVRRAVYEHLGGFDARVRSYGEDWEMWVRIAAHYPVWYEPEPLALYRVGGASLTSGAMRSGDNVRDLVRVIDLIGPLLPAADAERLRREALETTARTALERARRALGASDAVALAQVRAAWGVSRSPAVAAGTAHTGARWLLSLVDRNTAGR